MESIKEISDKDSLKDKIIINERQSILMKTEIQKLQQNLMKMGFDLNMINKIIFYYNLRDENQIINYLIKDENGKWNHPFIPKVEQEQENINNDDNLINSSQIMNNVLTKMKSIDLDYINNNNEICEICGEPKEFHISDIYENNNIPQKNNNFLNINDDNENTLISTNINTNTNNNIDYITDINTNINISSSNEEELIENTDKCPICMDSFENPISIEKCNHKFCQECFNNYLVELIKKNNIDKIPCPYLKCSNKNISEEFFSKYLSEEQYFKYRQYKSQNDIARDPKKMFCPLCDSYADIEGFTEKYDCNNPNYIKSNLICKNGHTFCSCGRPLHDGDCYHDDNNFQKYLEKEKIKQCPKCGFLIKKTAGCNHMTCGNPICRYEFCWLCMKECIPDHFTYGPCAGKQFFDPDSFKFKIKNSCPILSKLFTCFECLFWFLVFILFVFIFPALSEIFLLYLFLYRNIPRHKIYTFLHFITISLLFICLQSILYMLEFILLFIIILIIISSIISFVCCCFCCIRDRRDGTQMGNEIEMEFINRENNNSNNGRV